MARCGQCFRPIGSDGSGIPVPSCEACDRAGMTDADRKAQRTFASCELALRNWITEAVIALNAATTIGQRSCRDGDHLHYANHDRLVAEASHLLDALAIEAPR